MSVAFRRTLFSTKDSLTYWSFTLLTGGLPVPHNNVCCYGKSYQINPGLGCVEIHRLWSAISSGETKVIFCLSASMKDVLQSSLREMHTPALLDWAGGGSCSERFDWYLWIKSEEGLLRIRSVRSGRAYRLTAVSYRSCSQPISRGSWDSAAFPSGYSSVTDWGVPSITSLELPVPSHFLTGQRLYFFVFSSPLIGTPPPPSTEKK